MCAYAGHPERRHTDHGPQSAAAGWRSLTRAAGTHQLESGFESHNSLGVGERYHDVLRNAFRRVQVNHPDVPPEVALVLTVAAMNQMVGPHGLVPIMLVFGIAPRLPVTPLLFPEQLYMMRPAETARKELSKAVARRRINAALRARVLDAADVDLPVGTAVLVYRESPVDASVGPRTILSRRDKLA